MKIFNRFTVLLLTSAAIACASNAEKFEPLENPDFSGSWTEEELGEYNIIIKKNGNSYDVTTVTGMDEYIVCYYTSDFKQGSKSVLKSVGANKCEFIEVFEDGRQTVKENEKHDLGELYIRKSDGALVEHIKLEDGSTADVVLPKDPAQ